ncbi:aminodeoxychorismate/anthranilate synthase component II [Candidatus Peregrinibacteria bacterium CG_4_9_14_0_2_um_filter_53_11]|nr:MAG: aminodeoxychorismate/anthranilate synthase component II [Candidatus Peregrinibacteria bacterium CG_4_9_14_0_2_um_filter_53_11]
MKTLIIDNFDSFTYNLYQYCAQLGATPTVVRNNALTLEEIESEQYTHIIISPGPGTPEAAGDIGICGEVVKKITNTPILGVCLGHQIIMNELGGKIVRAPKPVHGKSSEIVIDTNSPLFSELPKKIEVMRYHSLIGSREKLPPTLRLTGETVDDQLIMAVQHISRPLFGIQFHPESIGTPHGMKILENFLSS